MKVKIDERYQAAIIELSGNLVGGENAELFRKKLYELIEQKKKNIVVDMTDIKMVSSTGIGILISGFTTLKNAGGDFKACSHFRQCERCAEHYKIEPGVPYLQ